MRWDAFVYAPDPDALAVEFAEHGAAFRVPLKDTHDGLRGFEICDLRLVLRSTKVDGVPSDPGVNERYRC